MFDEIFVIFHNDLFYQNGPMRTSSKLPSFISGFIFLIVFGFSSTHAQTIEDLKAGVVKITATVGEQKRKG